MVYILPVCFPLNMSKCNSENAVWIVSDSLDLIVYIYMSCIGPKLLPVILSKV